MKIMYVFDRGERQTWHWAYPTKPTDTFRETHPYVKVDAEFWRQAEEVVELALKPYSEYLTPDMLSEIIVGAIFDGLPRPEDLEEPS